MKILVITSEIESIKIGTFFSFGAATGFNQFYDRHIIDLFDIRNSLVTIF